MDFLDDRTRILVLEWNKNDADEVKQAEKTFTTYLKKGWIAGRPSLMAGRRLPW